MLARINILLFFKIRLYFLLSISFLQKNYQYNLHSSCKFFVEFGSKYNLSYNERPEFLFYVYFKKSDLISFFHLYQDPIKLKKPISKFFSNLDPNPNLHRDQIIFDNLKFEILDKILVNELIND